MTDQPLHSTIAERQRDLLLDGIKTMLRGCIKDGWTELWCKRLLERSASLDSPPQPDLAEIGFRAYQAVISKPGWTYGAAHMAAYDAMLMAAYDAMLKADPKIRELHETADQTALDSQSQPDLAEIGGKAIAEVLGWPWDDVPGTHSDTRRRCTRAAMAAYTAMRKADPKVRTGIVAALDEETSP